MKSPRLLLFLESSSALRKLFLELLLLFFLFVLVFFSSFTHFVQAVLTCYTNAPVLQLKGTSQPGNGYTIDIMDGCTTVNFTNTVVSYFVVNASAFTTTNDNSIPLTINVDGLTCTSSTAANCLVISDLVRSTSRLTITIRNVVRTITATISGSLPNSYNLIRFLKDDFSGNLVWPVVSAPRQGDGSSLVIENCAMYFHPTVALGTLLWGPVEVNGMWAGPSGTFPDYISNFDLVSIDGFTVSIQFGVGLDFRRVERANITSSILRFFTVRDVQRLHIQNLALKANAFNPTGTNRNWHVSGLNIRALILNATNIGGSNVADNNYTLLVKNVVVDDFYAMAVDPDNCTAELRAIAVEILQLNTITNYNLPNNNNRFALISLRDLYVKNVNFTSHYSPFHRICALRIDPTTPTKLMGNWVININDMSIYDDASTRGVEIKNVGLQMIWSYALSGHHSLSAVLIGVTLTNVPQRIVISGLEIWSVNVYRYHSSAQIFRTPAIGIQGIHIKSPAFQSIRNSLTNYGPISIRAVSISAIVVFCYANEVQVRGVAVDFATTTSTAPPIVLPSFAVSDVTIQFTRSSPFIRCVNSANFSLIGVQINTSRAVANQAYPVLRFVDNRTSNNNPYTFDLTDIQIIPSPLSSGDVVSISAGSDSVDNSVIALLAITEGTNGIPANSRTDIEFDVSEGQSPTASTRNILRISSLNMTAPSAYTIAGSTVTSFFTIVAADPSASTSSLVVAGVILSSGIVNARNLVIENVVVSVSQLMNSVAVYGVFWDAYFDNVLQNVRIRKISVGAAIKPAAAGMAFQIIAVCIPGNSLRMMKILPRVGSANYQKFLAPIAIQRLGGDFSVSNITCRVGGINSAAKSSDQNRFNSTVVAHGFYTKAVFVGNNDSASIDKTLFLFANIQTIAQDIFLQNGGIDVSGVFFDQNAGFKNFSTSSGIQIINANISASLSDFNMYRTEGTTATLLTDAVQVTGVKMTIATLIIPQSFPNDNDLESATDSDGPNDNDYLLLTSSNISAEVTSGITSFTTLVGTVFSHSCGLSVRGFYLVSSTNLNEDNLIMDSSASGSGTPPQLAFNELIIPVVSSSMDTNLIFFNLTQIRANITNFTNSLWNGNSLSVEAVKLALTMNGDDLVSRMKSTKTKEIIHFNVSDSSVFASRILFSGSGATSVQVVNVASSALNPNITSSITNCFGVFDDVEAYGTIQFAVASVRMTSTLTLASVAMMPVLLGASLQVLDCNVIIGKIISPSLFSSSPSSRQLTDEEMVSYLQKNFIGTKQIHATLTASGGIMIHVVQVSGCQPSNFVVKNARIDVIQYKPGSELIVNPGGENSGAIILAETSKGDIFTFFRNVYVSCDNNNVINKMLPFVNNNIDFSRLTIEFHDSFDIIKNGDGFFFYTTLQTLTTNNKPPSTIQLTLANIFFEEILQNVVGKVSMSNLLIDLHNADLRSERDLDITHCHFANGIAEVQKQITFANSTLRRRPQRRQIPTSSSAPSNNNNKGIYAKQQIELFGFSVKKNSSSGSTFFNVLEGLFVNNVTFDIRDYNNAQEIYYSSSSQFVVFNCTTSLKKSVEAAAVRFKSYAADKQGTAGENNILGSLVISNISISMNGVSSVTDGFSMRAFLSNVGFTKNTGQPTISSSSSPTISPRLDFNNIDFTISNSYISSLDLLPVVFTYAIANFASISLTNATIRIYSMGQIQKFLSVRFVLFVATVSMVPGGVTVQDCGFVDRPLSIANNSNDFNQQNQQKNSFLFTKKAVNYLQGNFGFMIHGIRIGNKLSDVGMILYKNNYIFVNREFKSSDTISNGFNGRVMLPELTRFAHVRVEENAGVFRMKNGGIILINNTIIANNFAIANKEDPLNPATDVLVSFLNGNNLFTDISQLVSINNSIFVSSITMAKSSAAKTLRVVPVNSFTVTEQSSLFRSYLVVNNTVIVENLIDLAPTTDVVVILFDLSLIRKNARLVSVSDPSDDQELEINIVNSTSILRNVNFLENSDIDNNLTNGRLNNILGSVVNYFLEFEIAAGSNFSAAAMRSIMVSNNFMEVGQVANVPRWFDVVMATISRVVFWSFLNISSNSMQVVCSSTNFRIFGSSQSSSVHLLEINSGLKQSDDGNNTRSVVKISQNKIYFDAVNTKYLVLFNSQMQQQLQYKKFLLTLPFYLRGSTSNNIEARFSNGKVIMSKYQVALISTKTPLAFSVNSTFLIENNKLQPLNEEDFSSNDNNITRMSFCPSTLRLSTKLSQISSSLKNSNANDLMMMSSLSTNTTIVYPTSLLHFETDLLDSLTDLSTQVSFIISKNSLGSPLLTESSLIRFASIDQTKYSNYFRNQQYYFGKSFIIKINFTFNQNEVFFSDTNNYASSVSCCGIQQLTNFDTTTSEYAKYGYTLLTASEAWKNVLVQNRQPLRVNFHDNDKINKKQSDDHYFSPFSNLAFTFQRDHASDDNKYPSFFEKVLLPRQFRYTNATIKFLSFGSSSSLPNSKNNDQYPALDGLYETPSSSASASNSFPPSLTENGSSQTESPTPLPTESRSPVETKTSTKNPTDTHTRWAPENTATVPYSQRVETSLAVVGALSGSPGAFQFTFKTKNIQQLATCEGASPGFRVSKLGFEDNPLDFRISLNKPLAPDPDIDTVDVARDKFGVPSARYSDAEFVKYLGSFVGNQIFWIVWLLVHFLISLGLPFITNYVEIKRFEAKQKMKRKRKIQEKAKEESATKKKRLGKKSLMDSKNTSSDKSYHNKKESNNESDDDDERPEKLKWKDLTFTQAMSSAKFPGQSAIIIGIVGPTTSQSLGTVLGVGIKNIYNNSDFATVCLVGSCVSSLIAIPCGIMFWTYYVTQTTKLPQGQDVDVKEDDEDDEEDDENGISQGLNTSLFLKEFLSKRSEFGDNRIPARRRSRRSRIEKQKNDDEKEMSLLGVEHSPSSNNNNEDESDKFHTSSLSKEETRKLKEERKKYLDEFNFFVPKHPPQYNDENNEDNSKKKKQQFGTLLRKVLISIKKLYWYFMCPFIEWRENNFIRIWGGFFDQFSNALLALFDYAAACFIGFAGGQGEACQEYKCCESWAISGLVVALLHTAAVLFMNPFMVKIDNIFYRFATVFTSLSSILSVVSLAQQKNNSENEGGGAEGDEGNALDDVLDVMAIISMVFGFMVMALELIKLLEQNWEYIDEIWEMYDGPTVLREKTGAKNGKSKKGKNEDGSQEAPERDSDTIHEKKRKKRTRRKSERIQVVEQENTINNANDDYDERSPSPVISKLGTVTSKKFPIYDKESIKRIKRSFLEEQRRINGIQQDELV